MKFASSKLTVNDIQKAQRVSESKEKEKWQVQFTVFLPPKMAAGSGLGFENQGLWILIEILKGDGCFH